MHRLISTFFCGFHILAHPSQVCVSKPIPFEDPQDRLSAWLVASCSSCFSDPGHIQNIAGQKSQTVGCQLYTYTVHIPYTPLYLGPGPSLNMFAIALPHLANIKVRSWISPRWHRARHSPPKPGSSGSATIGQISRWIGI